MNKKKIKLRRIIKAQRSNNKKKSTDENYERTRDVLDHRIATGVRGDVSLLRFPL